MSRLTLLSIFLFTVGCAETYTVFHSQTGEPLYLGRRAYSYEGCIETMRQEAAERGVSFRAVHVRGTWEGRSLLWPFEPGYACEAAIGPERFPSGPYLNVPPRTPQG